MQLITRASVGGTANASPFQSQLDRVAEDGSVELVCPYLSVDILQRLRQQAARLRIVTDAEEWITAYPRTQRSEILRFIARSSSAIRHYRGVHAKAAISPRKLLFGSANFTDKGLNANEELSAITEDSALIAEARRWFADLWERGVEVDLPALREYEKELPVSGAEGRPKRRLPPPKPRPRSRRRQPNAPPRTSEKELVRYLRELRVSRPLIEEYLDLVRLVYDELKIADEDPRAALTLGEEGFMLPLSINNRYSLAAAMDGKDALLCVLVPNGTVAPKKKGIAASFDTSSRTRRRTKAHHRWS